MIETAFRARTMAAAGGPDRAPASGHPTGRRAVRVATITRRANRKEAVAEADRFSGEAARPRSRSSRSLRLDIQPKPWHKRQDGLGVSEHEAVPRARRISPGPHLSVLSLRDHPHKQTPAKRAWTVPRLWTAQNAPTSRLENRTERGFPHRPRPARFSVRRIRKDQKTRTT